MNLRLTILCLLAITAASCAKQGHLETEGFWPWFKTNEKAFAELFSYESQVAARSDSRIKEKSDATFNEVADRLQEVHPEFTPFFGFSNGENQLTITVNGQGEYFDAVDRFIASAPGIANWKFIALKQPLHFSADTEIRSGTVNLKIDDIRYRKTATDHGRFDFEIHIPFSVADDPEGFHRLLNHLTRDMLGERFAATAIGRITVRQTDDQSNQLLPFTDIYSDIHKALATE